MTLTIPKGTDADREEADDRPARHRRDEDRHLQGLPGSAVRREDVGAGEREAGRRARRTRRTTAPSIPSSSRSSRWTQRSPSRSRRAWWPSSRSLVTLVLARPAATAPGRAEGRPRWRLARHGRLRGLVAGRGSTISTARSTRSPTGLSRVDRRVDGAITNTAVVRYDAYEDTGREAVGLVRLPRRDAHGHGGDGDPGSRLRAHLREGHRARHGVRRALAGGADGRRAGHGALSVPGLDRASRRSAASATSRRVTACRTAPDARRAGGQGRAGEQACSDGAAADRGGQLRQPVARTADGRCRGGGRRDHSPRRA